MSLAGDVAELERDLERCRTRLRNVDAAQAELARRMYRRGYLAGRAAARRGAPAETAPERHARGDLRRLLERTRDTFGNATPTP